jgi:hypothetical protein
MRAATIIAISARHEGIVAAVRQDALAGAALFTRLKLTIGEPKRNDHAGNSS